MAFPAASISLELHLVHGTTWSHHGHEHPKVYVVYSEAYLHLSHSIVDWLLKLNCRNCSFVIESGVDDGLSSIVLCNT